VFQTEAFHMLYSNESILFLMPICASHLP